MINIPYPLFSTAFCASTVNKEININDNNDSGGGDVDGDDYKDNDDDGLDDYDGDVYNSYVDQDYLSLHLSISYIQLEIFYHLVKTFHTRNHTNMEKIEYDENDNNNDDAHHNDDSHNNGDNNDDDFVDNNDLDHDENGVAAKYTDNLQFNVMCFYHEDI